MRSHTGLEQRFRADFQSRIRESEFVYAEQYDSPPFDYFLFDLRQDTFLVSEQIDLAEDSKQQRVTKEQHDRITLLAKAMPCNFAKLPDQVRVLGGTWICAHREFGEPCLCFKMESLTSDTRIVFEGWLRTLSETIKDFGVEPKGNWFVSPQPRSGDVSTSQPETLIVDMKLPPRIRSAANKLGLTKISDFANVRENLILEKLGGTYEEKDALLEQLKAELESFGISLAVGSK